MNFACKKKLLLVVVSLVFLVSLISFSNVVNSKVSNQNQTNNQNMIKDDQLKSELKNYKSTQEINENISFTKKKPTYLYNDMKEVSTEGETQNSTLNDFQIIETLYKTKDNKDVKIQQAQDTGKPEDLLKECEKTSINGVDAWIYGKSEKDNYAQILFWANGFYFNISGDIGVQELKNISKSLM